MINERLRRSMLRAGYDTVALADAASVSAKSVERWLAGQVVPYPRTRYRVAALVGEDEAYLWPGGDRAALAAAELVSAWPRRNDVPPGLWTGLLREATHHVDVLAFAGLFHSPGGTSGGCRCYEPAQRPAPASGCCSATRPARTWPHATRRPASVEASPAGWQPSWPTTGRCWASPSCGCTTRCCTTRSTGSTTTCWSTYTRTACSPPTRRCFTCAA